MRGRTYLLIVLVVFSSSCGLIVLVVFSSSWGGSSSGTDTATAAADGPRSFENFEYVSPIADFLGQDINRFDFDEAAAIEQQREAERVIALCMAEKGFEYPPTNASQMVSFRGPQDDFDPGSDEWINKYGFGISTQRFPQSMVGDLAVDARKRSMELVAALARRQRRVVVDAASLRSGGSHSPGRR